MTGEALHTAPPYQFLGVGNIVVTQTSSRERDTVDSDDDAIHRHTSEPLDVSVRRDNPLVWDQGYNDVYNFGICTIDYPLLFYGL